MKRLLFTLFIAGLFVTNLAAQGTKFGYANFEYIVSKMPDMKSIEVEIQTLNQQYEAQLQAKIQEIQELEAQLQNSEGQPAAVVESLKSDYQYKLSSIERLKQTAEMDLVGKQEELLQPVLFLYCFSEDSRQCRF